MKLLIAFLCFSIQAFAVDPFPTAPLCPSHDPRAWHGLWDSVRGCHYDHHHGNNPHLLDDVFGNSYFSGAGGDISYPWQTFNSVTGALENNAKHQGYVWLTDRELPCPTTSAQGTFGCIPTYRAQVHQMADGHDANVRYHSFSLQAVVRPNLGDPWQSGDGTITIGGWQDTGDLEVDGVVVIDEPNSGNRVKQHSAHGAGAVWYPSSTQGPGGQQGLARVSVTVYDQWDYTAPSNPGGFTDFVCYPAPRCRINDTSFVPHLIVVDVPNEYLSALDPNGDHLVNYTGYLTRYGAIATGCSQTSLDCVPVSLSNVRTDLNYGLEGHAPARDFDVYFNNRSAGWNQPLR
jgi:hypothetical protein